MVALSVPHTIDELSPGWLTAALRNAGILRAGRVAEVATTTVGAESGLVSQTVRLQLTYTAAEPAALVSLIAKLSSVEERVRARAGRLGRNFEREVYFYQQLAPSVPIQTPRCFHAAVGDDIGWFILLLEDLGAAREGSDITGCSFDDAVAALRTIARLHAAFWDSPLPGTLPWLLTPEIRAQRSGLPDSAVFDSFARRLGDGLPASLLAVLKKIPEALQRGLLMPAGPRTLVHGDFSAKNMFFVDAPDGTDRTDVVLFDWQLTARAPAAFDVSQFINVSLPATRLPAEAVPLLQQYHEALQALGVRGYPFPDLLHDYRCATLRQALAPVALAGGIAEPPPERLQTAWYTLERIQAVLEGFDPLPFLEG